MDVNGKVVILTGASSGIGMATAKLLASKGAKVSLASRSKEKLNALSKTLPESIFIQTDMTKEEEIKDMVSKTFEHYGKVDILINNAGIGYYSFLEKINASKFRELIEIDLIGPIIAMQSVIPVMRKQRNGVIVNISSGTASRYLPGLGAYSSAKRALGGISLTAREELKKEKIIVSVVYPYITITNFGKNSMKEGITEYPTPSGPNLPPPDAAEFVAEKILNAIETGEAELFVHEWMKPK